MNLPETLRDKLRIGQTINARNGHVASKILGKLIVGRLGLINNEFVLLGDVDEPKEFYPVTFDLEPAPGRKMTITKVNAYSIQVHVEKIGVT
jgi:hypothetical protein